MSSSPYRSSPELASPSRPVDLRLLAAAMTVCLLAYPWWLLLTHGGVTCLHELLAVGVVLAVLGERLLRRLRSNQESRGEKRKNVAPVPAEAPSLRDPVEEPFLLGIALVALGWSEWGAPWLLEQERVWMALEGVLLGASVWWMSRQVSRVRAGRRSST